MRKIVFLLIASLCFKEISSQIPGYPLWTFSENYHTIKNSSNRLMELKKDSNTYTAEESSLVVIEGKFGKAEVNVTYPSLSHLYLRSSDGQLNTHSLLAQEPLVPQGAVEGSFIYRTWAKEGYTYVVGEDGLRYESRMTSALKVDVDNQNGRTGIRIMGVKLSAGKDSDPVATEDWTLSAPGDGFEFVWKIVRSWEKDFTSVLSGSPSLFFSFNVPYIPNSVTTTIWYDPLRITAQYNDTYDATIANAFRRRSRALTKNLIQTVTDRDSWAIYKLWTDWNSTADLRLEVEGGYLFRRGKYGHLGEAGAITNPETIHSYFKGEVEEITLKSSSADNFKTGYQLLVNVPDKEMEGSLKHFYGSLFNGGLVADQKSYEFGNESDGYLYSGSSWMQGFALAAGVPSKEALSLYPYDAASAFRGRLANVLTTMDDQGRDHYGFNHTGQWVDCNLHVIIGIHQYLLHSGDLPFVRQNLPAMERMLEYFTRHRNNQGLFRLEGEGAHWYYDVVKTSGVNGYYNTFFYKAACDMAEMESAAGYQVKAQEYLKLADSIKAAYNRVLWKEEAPGGPRYLDWIDGQGQEVSYFCDICQWPAIAVGIASPDQARKIVATANARIAQIEKEFGYQGYACLSALWPIPDNVNLSPPPRGVQVWGVCMNGGSLLAQTYWEVTARAMAGDISGATQRLKLFAQKARETGWAGKNTFSIKAEPQLQEPYLADMVVVPAALINGVLGIKPNWNNLEVNPKLPVNWPSAEADILYKGQRYHITIEGKDVSIKPLEQIIKLPLTWVMDANMWKSPTGIAKADNIEFGNGGSVALKKVYDDRGALALWKLDDTNGPVPDATPHQNHGIPGSVNRDQQGHSANSKSYSFTGKETVVISNGEGGSTMDHELKIGPYAPLNGSLSFGPTESFSLQCWFKTEAFTTQYLVDHPGAYSMYVDKGKMGAYLMQDGGRITKALGDHKVTDGQWHHAAAIFDRQKQQLLLYLDGKLDTPEGRHTATNPADISVIGRSSSLANVTLGNALVGSLDEVSIFYGALKLNKFSFERDYPSPYGTSKISYADIGIYQSPLYDWAELAMLRDITIAVKLNGGRVRATIETSSDGFMTVYSEVSLAVRDGVNTYMLHGLKGSATAVRVQFRLVPNKDNTATPVVDAFRITGQPAKSALAY